MLMRFTLVDEGGAISFPGPGHILKMLAASIRTNESTTKQLLDQLALLDEKITDDIRRGIAVFDEHCLENEPASIDAWIANGERLLLNPFRVVDPVTRNVSLRPERLGLVIFNLIERRIVQVQNSYGALLRCDRGRLRKSGRPISSYYRYQLPDEWSIVP